MNQDSSGVPEPKEEGPEKGESPAPNDLDTGDTPGNESGDAIDADLARDRAS